MLLKTNSTIKPRKIAEGLNSPWGIIALPDGSFAITEKGGTLRVMSPNRRTKRKHDTWAS